ncbi:MAG: GGDEF domain-containing protein [Pseudomonadales bacterium]|jgi:diguanylate cyclase (GGDEF)-like protein|nr:GGDEF domain-containing protein [Pseudomonadales bacterium]
MTGTVYVPLALALVSGLLAIVLALVWRTIERAPHLLAWSGAFVAASLQWLSLLQVELSAEPRPWGAVLGDGFAVAAVAFTLLGYRLRAGHPLQSVLLAGGACVVFAVELWFTAVAPHLGFAAGVVPLFSAVLLAFAAWAVPKKREAVLTAEWASIALVGFFGLVQLAAGLSAIASGPDGSPEWALLRYLALPAAYPGLGICMLLLVATDLSERMNDLAITDPLTAVLNRRGFLDATLRAISQARRSAQPLSLIMADVDHFKRINDSYGHAAGDRALTRFAAHLDSELRQSDLVGRIGGEEFALLLSNTDLETAAQVAERLRRTFAMATMEIGGARVQLTASFGVAALSSQDGDVEDLLERADQGLHAAKDGGRNRVCAAPLVVGA